MTVTDTVTQTSPAPTAEWGRFDGSSGSSHPLDDKASVRAAGAGPTGAAGTDTAGRNGAADPTLPTLPTTEVERTCTAEPAPHPRPDGQDLYTISEVASFTGLSAHTLRWYERIGLMPHIDRSHAGQRRYRNQDLDWLDLVGKLRLTGMPVADMVRFSELVRGGDETFSERRLLLEATRREVLARIAELHGTLAVLNHKIDYYAAATTSAVSEGTSSR
jgi:DNA-binding transcriptional MerR regulator